MRTRTPAVVLSAFAVWALLVCPLLGRIARAQTGNAEIDRGIGLYNDLEYEKAAEALANALAGSAALTKQEATEGYKVLGLSYVALGREEQAKQAFKKLLAANPAYELPSTESPKALDLFEQVRATLPKTGAGAVQLTQAASPVRPGKGSPITVSIALVDDGLKTKGVVVYHRVRGQKGYSSVTAAPGPGSGRFNAIISGTFVNPPAIEYYVIATDAGGQALDAEGSAEEPMVLVVDQEAGAATPIYGKWWFWTAVGGVLVAGAITAIALSGDDGGGGDATVNITVTYPTP